MLELLISKNNSWGDLRQKIMSKKPSFLERLTGALKEEEDEEKNKEEEEVVEEIPMEKPKAQKPKKMNIADESSPKEDSDWLPETEGQLTIDVYQTPLEIIIKSTVAGVNPEDLDVTITNDMVTIKGKRERDEEIQSDDYYYQECYWGSFSRSVILPVDVEAEKTEASMKNGILTIRLPKIEKIKTKKIKVIG